MIVCPDCRTDLTNKDGSCQCGWGPRLEDGVAEYLTSEDRAGAESAEYIENYDVLAEHTLVDPLLSDKYTANLARRFSDAIGDVRGKDVCDVGAGRGYLIESLLAKSPKSAVAIDIAAPSVKDVAQKFDVTGIVANAEHLPFERHFDVIAATDIVEHVVNVSNFLVTANWALRDDGILAIRVPFMESMLYYSNYFGMPMHYAHLRTFDRHTLVALLEPFGFKAKKVVYDGFFANNLQPAIRKVPLLNHVVRKTIKLCFSSRDDVTSINPTLGQLLMRPVEIGIIARKVQHVEPIDAYGSLSGWFEGKSKSRFASPG